VEGEALDGVPGHSGLPPGQWEKKNRGKKKTEKIKRKKKRNQ
jgi:hypothetical protein